MPRPSSIPMLYDSCKVLEIGFLKKHRYLQTNASLSGTVTWSKHGQVTSSISICVEMGKLEGILTLSYSSRDINYNYTVEIIAKESNLGKGHVYYFFCPFTFKCCRRLYLINGKFGHREAGNGLYDSQTQSQNTRALLKLYDIHQKEEKVYSQLYKKYFKPTYNGQPTKKMVKLQQMLDFYNRVKDKIPSEEMLLMR